jgi:hypothetical protein
MKITIIAAAAAISLSVGSAYACEDSAGSATNTRFTHTSDVVAQASVQSAPRVVPTTEAQDRRLILLYVTGSGQGTWLFAPNQNEGNNN